MTGEEKQDQTINIFGKWSIKDIEIEDLGLKSYISLNPVFTPHSSGKHEHKRFKKSKVNIIERLANNLMRPGKSGGKKTKALDIIRNAFQIIELKIRKNPVQVFIKAIENSAPCEEVTRIVYGGVAYPVSVDISPQRRTDLALRYLTDASRKAALNNPKTIDECLADEIIFAHQRDPKSQAVKKRDEVERIALSSR